MQINKQTVTLADNAWAIGNRGEGYQVFVATDVCDYELGYAETIEEARELLATFEGH